MKLNDSDSLNLIDQHGMMTVRSYAHMWSLCDDAFDIDKATARDIFQAAFNYLNQHNVYKVDKNWEYLAKNDERTNCYESYYYDKFYEIRVTKKQYTSLQSLKEEIDNIIVVLKSGDEAPIEQVINFVNKLNEIKKEFIYI